MAADAMLAIGNKTMEATRAANLRMFGLFREVTLDCETHSETVASLALQPSQVDYRRSGYVSQIVAA